MMQSVASTAVVPPVEVRRDPGARQGDPWGEVLGELEMVGVFCSTGRFSEPWGLELPALPRTLMYHLLLDGRAVVDVEGATLDLAPGDVVLVPHGTGHRVTGTREDPASGLWDVERTVVQERYEQLRIDGGGRPATLVCGAAGFADPGVGRLLASLPPVLRAPGGGATRAVVEAIGDETRHPRPGTDVVTARLADVVLVHAIRGWLEAAEPASGWLGALRDPALGPVLRAVHGAPAEPWTLESLAARARLSRSAFAERFAAVVGEPPMAYVAGHRMDVAARLLREPGASVAAVAGRVGYESAPGFHRAFVRRHGCTPGTWRTAAGPRTLEDVLGA
ncbi:AraC family transcriptional regulator [Isoptericola sp. NEAU-Y5]|uniref:AraC family transcriptional regulator n=1 Tax=Isoptericola luteus TaxID=2879484 RepID=A0ABS7ZEL3_9MICO|nr:AraC family transcriptional regulator [Isoptericola sp. NEAU-Y5]MCA5893474.1 AraC family transcriptional regulator [Isoptericola sp. NEAU-Y5]